MRTFKVLFEKPWPDYVELIEDTTGNVARYIPERSEIVYRRQNGFGGITEHCGWCGADLGCDTRNRQIYCPHCGAKLERDRW